MTFVNSGRGNGSAALWVQGAGELCTLEILLHVKAGGGVQAHHTPGKKPTRFLLSLQRSTMKEFNPSIATTLPCFTSLPNISQIFPLSYISVLYGTYGFPNPLFEAYHTGLLASMGMNVCPPRHQVVRLLHARYLIASG